MDGVCFSPLCINYMFTDVFSPAASVDTSLHSPHSPQEETGNYYSYIHAQTYTAFLQVFKSYKSLNF